MSSRRLRPWVASAGAVGLLAWLGAGSRASQEHHHPAGPAEPASGYEEMGPHMKVTAKRAPRTGDLERAERTVKETRRIIERYRDHRVALQDGFKPFLPQLPLPEYHFTNYWYGFEAAFRFNVEHPTSLLYVKEGGHYRLTGVMFTAGANASLEDLDSRLPLSLGQWHLHTNLCMPPRGRGAEMLRANARFGFAGSISTAQECEEAGGRFFPHMFGWMVHVYPYEDRREDVFRMPGHHDHGQKTPAHHEGHGH